jgi:hypothetical protein
MIAIDLIKVLLLFVGVWFTIVNIIRVALNNNIPGINIMIQAIGITGFIYFQWLI